MSRIQQKNFLNKLLAEIEHQSTVSKNAEDRNLFNTRVHLFTLSARAVRRAIRDSVEKASDGNKKLAKEIVIKSLGSILTFISEVGTNIQRYEKRNLASVQEASARRIVVLFPANGRDVFRRVKRVYKKPLDKLFEEINKKSSNMFEKREEIFVLEHDHFMGVLETSLEQTISRVIEENSSNAVQTMEGVKNFFKSREIDVRVIRNSETDRMEIFLGSFVANQKEQGEARARKNALKRVLRESIKALEDNKDFSFAELEGSDSAVQKRRKQIIKAATKNLEKKKGIRVSVEDTKIKNSKTSVKGKIKGKGALKPLVGKNKSIVRARPKNTIPNLQQLIGILNEQLPRTVAKNMGDPRLNYRTGRFAASVQVTDIATTTKGFPSVGYTYMKYPYQTFEPGYRQGSVDRDPRKLIDASIREIAAQFAIGRFYTRRV